MSTVVGQLVGKMNANRIATRTIFGEKMAAAVTNAVEMMDAVTAAKTAADTAAVTADTTALSTYESAKTAAQQEIDAAISHLLSNSDYAAYADSKQELKEAIEADQDSATATLLAYVTDETAKTDDLKTEFGILADVEAEFVGFLGGA
jgi:cell wall-associated NlpC family hydrolase